jgi:choline-glycine betaine transporter
VTLPEVLVRIVLAFGPFFAPFLLGMDKNDKIVIPALWLILFGPIWFIPFSNNWTEAAEPFRFIWEKIGYFYLALICLGGIGFLLGIGHSSTGSIFD